MTHLVGNEFPVLLLQQKKIQFKKRSLINVIPLLLLFVFVVASVVISVVGSLVSLIQSRLNDYKF